MRKLSERLINWYEDNKRDLPWREVGDSYKTWVSEIMLQQTRVEAVKEYYTRFIKYLPTLEDLAKVEEDTLLKLWEGLGYYSRVRNMQKAAKQLVEQGYKTLPDSEEALLSLPGIGKYTAGAILGIAYDLPSVAIDGNVYRVLARTHAIKEDILSPKTYKTFEMIYKKEMPNHNYGAFIQGFMDLGSSICLPKNPKCKECPLQDICMAHQKKEEEIYPVRIPKTKRKIEERSVYLLLYKNEVALHKREASGLLANLYEFPNDLEIGTISDIENHLTELEIEYLSVEETQTARHIFSHITWYMKGYIVELKSKPEGYIWATKEELESKYSIPSAFKKYTEIVKRIV